MTKVENTDSQLEVEHTYRYINALQINDRLDVLVAVEKRAIVPLLF